MKVNVSITDLPLFSRMEHVFSRMKETGADGVEVVSGIKSRWRWQRMKALSDKYSLPITSVHQPPWSVLNVYFDENNIRKVVDMGIRTFVFHPIPSYSFADKPMIVYLEKLAAMKKKYTITVALENMPSVYRRGFAPKLMPLSRDTMDLRKMAKVVKQYGLDFNLDTSHVFLPRPHEEPWFDEIFPYMKNIHLSSFAVRDHLPLYMGDFDTSGFLKELKRRKYKGLITLEIFYPRMVRLRGYDYEAIRRSVEMVKAI